MPEDSGGEPWPPVWRAASRVAGPLPEDQPSSAATNPEMPVPADLPPGAQLSDAHLPDGPHPDPLIPEALPVLPRLRLSARRRPGDPQPDAEGDWLDVIVLPDGATALVIGHAEAHGGPPGAAAARLRAGLRDALRRRAAPAEALAALGPAVSGPAPASAVPARPAPPSPAAGPRSAWPCWTR